MMSSHGNPKKLRSDILNIIKAVIDSSDPKRAVSQGVRIEGDTLSVGEKQVRLNEFDNIYILGAGKATASMAFKLENTLGDRLTGGVISVKRGFGDYPRQVKVIEASHPVPDDNSATAATEALALAASAGASDLIICVISGGASALWCLPTDDLTLEDKIKTTEALLRCGADIYEINMVRKHISGIKGGRLARAAYPAALITLAASDVVGDDVSFIGSGPTVPDPSTFEDAIDVIEKYRLIGQISQPVIEHIRNGCAGKASETLKENNSVFQKNIAQIIASNKQAVGFAAERARELKYQTKVIGCDITGEAREVGRRLAETARQVLTSSRPVKPPAVLLAGGETTVTIRGHGKGGRNQELALSAAMHISGLKNVVIASFGTDGNDGPTDAAGAVVDGNTIARADTMGLSAEKYLEDNNSYEFFSKLGDLIKTGPTGINLMDIQIIAIGHH